MIEFYEYDGEEYVRVGAIDNGEVVQGDLEFIVEFIEEDVDDVDITDEQAVVDRVSNPYFMGVTDE